MQIAALAIIALFALWIGAAGLAALFDPRRARGWIALFATSHAVNLAEQGWRALAGAALILRAPYSLAPTIFAVAGWFLVASAAVILVVPLRWHAAYAQYCAAHLPLALVRLGGAIVLPLAAAMVMAALG